MQKRNFDQNWKESIKWKLCLPFIQNNCFDKRNPPIIQKPLQITWLAQFWRYHLFWKSCFLTHKWKFWFDQLLYVKLQVWSYLTLVIPTRPTDRSFDKLVPWSGLHNFYSFQWGVVSQHVTGGLRKNFLCIYSQRHERCHIFEDGRKNFSFFWLVFFLKVKSITSKRNSPIIQKPLQNTWLAQFWR